MTSQFDIIDNQGERLISGLSHGDACEHIRYWTSRGVVASMQRVEEWNPEHDRRPIDLSLVDIAAECLRIRETWGDIHGKRQPGRQHEGELTTDHGKKVNFEIKAA